jgi:hypothetical protein
VVTDMKSLVLRSLIIAAVLAPLAGFATYIFLLRNITEYIPPISETELQQMDKLPVEQVKPILAARTVKISRMQWLADSVGSAYLWHAVAVRSIAPFIAIFAGCVCIGVLERRRARSDRPTDAA